MKKFLIVIAVLISSGSYAQITKMVLVKDQTFQMNGVQHGQPVEKVTKVFGLTINYDTGELNGVVNLIELDLLNKNVEPAADPEMDALKIKGFLPVEQIRYNQLEQAQYKVELELIIKEHVVPVLFNFDIIYVKNTQKKFHNVRAVANVNLEDFKINDMNGFEPQVNIILMFQMLNLQR